MFREEDLFVEEVQVGLGLDSPEGPLCERMDLTPLLRVKEATILMLGLRVGLVTKLI